MGSIRYLLATSGWLGLGKTEVIEMVGTGTQKVNSVREFLGLLADDDNFRDSLQQNPGLALKYLGVLGNSTPVIPDTKYISLPPKEEVRQVLEQFDFALEHTGDGMELQGWGAWAAWFFAFLSAKTYGTQEPLN